VLRLIVTSAVEALRSGQATAEQAVLHAAVHGWYEGHIQGEDACPAATTAANYPNRLTELAQRFPRAEPALRQALAVLL
jgi:hypothetical protein